MSTESFGEAEIPATEAAWSSQGSARGSQQSTKETAKEQARGVAQEGVEGGKHVATVAADQAKEVASEAGRQGKALFGQARSELMGQVSNQQSRAADQLLSLSHQLGSMASASREEGPAKDLAQQASRQAGMAAHWLSERDPSALVSELKNFARNKPGTFLAVAAGIGMIAGRMTRGVKEGPLEESANSPSRSIQGYASTGGYTDSPLAGDPLAPRRTGLAP